MRQRIVLESNAMNEEGAGKNKPSKGNPKHSPSHQKPLKFETMSPVQIIKQSTNGQFGNSKDYYKKRGAIGFNDPRITFFDSKFLTNKKVLDLGCHDGSLTLQIALRYLPKKLNAVDIDYRLINRAVKNMLLFENKRDIQQGTKELHTKQVRALETLSNMPKSFIINDQALMSDNQGKLICSASKRQNERNERELGMINELEADTNFPANVNFGIANIASENFINELDIINNNKETDNNTYDTILCLSLTKWIQLNWGDNGIFTLFSNISK